MRVRLQVAFITGQSDPGRCALSPEQQAFLDALPVPEHAKVRRNFPYEESLPYREVSLAVASVNNVRQFLRAGSATFAERHRAPVRRMLEGADDTLFLAGSCGLELLAGLLLSPAELARVSVFAYGPVARRAPACEIVCVRGRGDWVSRAWVTSVDHLVAGGHMHYLENADVRRLCVAMLRRLETRIHGARP